MPSGAKKRKAAKKKKEQEAHHFDNNNNHPCGNGNPKNEDENENDGEVSFAASHNNNNNQHPHNGRNEESVKEVTGNAEGSQYIGGDNEGHIKIEKEVKPEEDSEGGDVSIDHDRRSSSSSDDESHIIEKKIDENVHTLAPEGKSYNIVDEPVDSLSEEVMQITEKVSLQGVDVNSIVGTVVDSVKAVVSKSKEMIYVKEGTSNETNVVKSSVTETEEKFLPQLNEISGLSLAVVDLASKLDAKNIFPLSHDDVGASSCVVESVVEGDEGKVLSGNEGKVLSDAPVGETCKGVESFRDSKISECPEKQPLLASAPPVVQRTSWLSCCGLLDVITGSSR